MSQYSTTVYIQGFEPMNVDKETMELPTTVAVVGELLKSQRDLIIVTTWSDEMSEAQVASIKEAFKGVLPDGKNYRVSAKATKCSVFKANVIEFSKDSLT